MSQFALSVTVINDLDQSHYDYHGTIQSADNIQELKLHPQLFYLKNNAPIPKFPHFEIELNPESLITATEIKFHVHESEINGLPYMCWTYRIPDLETAKSIFRLWCLGTTYTKITGKDFSKLFYEAVTTENFIKVLADKFHLRLAE